jgi:hypothetical protein
MDPMIHSISWAGWNGGGLVECWCVDFQGLPGLLEGYFGFIVGVMPRGF